MTEENLEFVIRSKLFVNPRRLPRRIDVLGGKLSHVFISNTRIADSYEAYTSILKRVVVGKLFLGTEVRWKQLSKALTSRSPVVVAGNSMDETGRFIENRFCGLDANITQQNKEYWLL